MCHSWNPGSSFHFSVGTGQNIKVTQSFVIKYGYKQGNQFSTYEMRLCCSAGGATCTWNITQQERLANFQHSSPSAIFVLDDNIEEASPGW